MKVVNNFEPGIIVKPFWDEDFYYCRELFFITRSWLTEHWTKGRKVPGESKNLCSRAPIVWMLESRRHQIFDLKARVQVKKFKNPKNFKSWTHTLTRISPCPPIKSWILSQNLNPPPYFNHEKFRRYAGQWKIVEEFVELFFHPHVSMNLVNCREKTQLASLQFSSECKYQFDSSLAHPSRST